MGIGNINNVKEPIEWKTMKPEKVKIIATGSFHTILVDKNDKLYSFGQNTFGQLGLGNHEAHVRPKLIKFNTDPLNSFKIKMVACGGYHNFILTNCGKLYGFG